MQDRAEEAEAVFETALRGAHKLGARIFIADALYGMAAALVSLGKTAASATCYALAQEASAEFKLVSREDFARKLAERRLPEGVKARTSRPVFHAAGAYRDPDAVISLTRSLGS
jgi:hypothetical protein